MTDETQSAAADRRAIVGAVVLVTLIGALVRIVPVAMVDFPLSDGGLFVTMTGNLMDNGFRLPFETTYNAAGIPFLYPPLGFYLVGITSAVTSVDLFTMFRFVPLVVAIVAIPAMFYLALALMPTRLGATVATLCFALIPRSFEYTIAGGGLTRGLGVLLAILVLGVAVRIATKSTPRRTVALGIAAALAGLSHPEAVVVCAVWLLVVLVTAGDRLRVLKSFVLAGLIAFVVALPWLVSVIGSHGLGPLLGAGATGSDIANTLTVILAFNLTDEAFLAIIGVLALVGLILRTTRFDWRWILWIVGVIAIDPRGGSNYLAAILGPLAGIAVIEVLMPALRWNPPSNSIAWPNRSIGTAPRIALLSLLGLTVAGAIGARSNDLSPLFALSPDVRQAISDVRDHTPTDAGVVVISGTGWWVDATAEWFPVLAERRSVATVQGVEWLGKDAWRTALDAELTLTGCAFDSVACFETWLESNGTDATYVFLPRGVPTASPLDTECCPALRTPLIVAGYPVVFDEPGGTLLRIPR